MLIKQIHRSANHRDANTRHTEGRRNRAQRGSNTGRQGANTRLIRAPNRKFSGTKTWKKGAPKQGTCGANIGNIEVLAHGTQG